MALKTYHGSCHCGAVRYEADLALAVGTINCNCSICTKMRNWGASVPVDAFRLLSGESVLQSYKFNTHVVDHLFCRECGIHSFSRIDSPQRGGPRILVQVACLDDASLEELISAPVRYANGRTIATLR
jgi:hypothetical protein